MEIHPPESYYNIKIVVKKPWARGEFADQSYNILETEMNAARLTATIWQHATFSKESPIYIRDVMVVSSKMLEMRHRNSPTENFEVTTCEIL